MMNKKKNIVKKIVVLVLFMFSVFVFVTIFQKIQHKKEIAQNIVMLPAFSFTDLQGNAFTNAHLNPNWATVFVYFNSECDYCLHEAQSIRENLTRFHNTQFVFVSTETTENIKQFAEMQQLLGAENVLFVQDSDLVFTKKFDVNSIPYSLIYNNQNELLYRHKGQIKAETILLHLQK